MSKLRFCIALTATAALTAPASAGEITGNGKPVNNRGNSECSFSGQNDTPEGFWLPIGPGGSMVQIDPGGHVQSYGYFKSHYDWFDSPSDADARDGPFPGNLCNPSR